MVAAIKLTVQGASLMRDTELLGQMDPFAKIHYCRKHPFTRVDPHHSQFAPTSPQAGTSFYSDPVSPQGFSRSLSAFPSASLPKQQLYSAEACTRTLPHGGREPEWKETFLILVEVSIAKNRLNKWRQAAYGRLRFSVQDEDMNSSDVVGQTKMI